jgi:hypothetical protein
MAMPEEVIRVVQQMQSQLVQLNSDLAAERRRNDGLTRMSEAVEKLVSRNSARLVDTRGLGRPGSFGGGDEKTNEKQFPTWARKLQNYVVSVFPDMADPMNWAVLRPGMIADDELDKAFGAQADLTDQVSDLGDKNHQLYSVLMQVTEGEANDIVCNSRTTA